jgi:hypothetical protein
MRPEIFKTKVTRLRPGLYGCRVLFAEDDTVFAELRVPKNQIGDAFFDILRTADKLGYDSPMAHATRRRQKGRVTGTRYFWGAIK